MFNSRWISFGLFILFITAITGCNNHGTTGKMNTSIDDLGDFVSLSRNQIESAKWELMSLPDSSDVGVPGPTDYLSLIAVIITKEDKQLLLNDLPMLNITIDIPKQFLKNWLPSEAASKLRQIGTQSIPVRDASKWVRQQAKTAFVVEIKNGMVLYVEYIKP